MDKAALRQLCALARIDLSEAEGEEIAAKFNSLLKFVDQLLAYQSADAPTAAEIAERSASSVQLELRRDAVLPFTWEAGKEHEYTVCRIINAEGDH